MKLNPQALILVEAAKLLSLWPPIDAIESVYETARGPLRIWINPRKCKIIIKKECVKLVEAISDLVISPIADKVLINDKLQIVLEDSGKGLWKLKNDPSAKIRFNGPSKILEVDCLPFLNY